MRHNTRQRQLGQHSEPHGRLYLILGRASPRRIPLESAEVSLARGHNSTSQYRALRSCRLLRCLWHQRGQPTKPKRTGFRNQHTQRGILTDQGGKSSARGASSGATRGGGSIIVVFFCTLHSALSAGCRRGSRKSCMWSYDMQTVKVARSVTHTAVNLKHKFEMHLLPTSI